MEQFNAGDYYGCHETLEDLWVAENRPVRRLYQGILQVGVAFHHLQQGNERGALSLLKRGPALLRPFAPACLGLDIAGLIEGARRVEETIERFGGEKTRELGPELFPRIRRISCTSGDIC